MEDVAYRVLARLSAGYSLLKGRLPMYSSPVCHFTTPKSLSFDLHVLGAPPAFVLSQDQTLKKIILQINKGRHSNTLVSLFLFSYSVVKELVRKRYSFRRTLIIGKNIDAVKHYFKKLYHYFLIVSDRKPVGVLGKCHGLKGTEWLSGRTERRR